jgi:hypothetical protein
MPRLRVRGNAIESRRLPGRCASQRPKQRPNARRRSKRSRPRMTTSCYSQQRNVPGPRNRPLTEISTREPVQPQFANRKSQCPSANRPSGVATPPGPAITALRQRTVPSKRIYWTRSVDVPSDRLRRLGFLGHAGKYRPQGKPRQSLSGAPLLGAGPFHCPASFKLDGWSIVGASDR